MHAAYIRPGGLKCDITTNLAMDIHQFAEGFNCRLNELEVLLTNNRIWQQRLHGVGIAQADQAKTCSFSGVMLRASGVP